MKKIITKYLEPKCMIAYSAGVVIFLQLVALVAHAF